MGRDPAVTVLMSVYNGEPYLREAVESVLGQVFSDFEFLIIDDASTDRTVEIVESYRDPRIRLYHNERNLGLTVSLNKGIELARGRYIARMDGDDISLPERLSRQFEFMESHPSVGVCGTWAKTIDPAGNITGELSALTGASLKNLCWRPSPFLHPTVMVRADLMKSYGYNPEYRQAQDYELWLRLSPITDFHNLKNFLYLYRNHGKNVSKTYRKQQLSVAYKAFSEYIGNNKINYDGFLALIPEETKVDPLRRAFYWWLASARTGYEMKSLLLDNLIYLRLWVKSFLIRQLTSKEKTPA